MATDPSDRPDTTAQRGMWVLDDDESVRRYVRMCFARHAALPAREFEDDTDLQVALGQVQQSGPAPLLIWCDLNRRTGPVLTADGQVLASSRELPCWLRSTTFTVSGLRLRGLPLVVCSGTARKHRSDLAQLHWVTDKPVDLRHDGTGSVHWLLAAHLARLEGELADAGVELDSDRLPRGNKALSTPSIAGRVDLVRPHLQALQQVLQRFTSRPADRPRSRDHLPRREAVRAEGLLMRSARPAPGNDSVSIDPAGQPPA